MPGYNLKKKNNIVLFFTYRVDPDEMQSRECSIMLHFILVFTVCKSFHGFFDHIKLIAHVTRKPLLGTGKILDISA